MVNTRKQVIGGIAFLSVTVGALLFFVAQGSNARGKKTIIEEPGVTLPAQMPTPEFDKKVIALNNRAVEAFADGKNEEAEKLLNEAIAKNPRYFTAYASLSTVLVHQEKYKKALPVLQKLVELRPRSSGARLILAYCLHQNGQDTEAEKQLRYAIAANNAEMVRKLDNDYARVARAIAVYIHGETGLARREIEALTARKPELKDAYRGLLKMMKDQPLKDRWRILFN